MYSYIGNNSPGLFIILFLCKPSALYAISAADLNNRFDGCKMWSTGKNGASLQVCKPTDWLYLENSKHTIDGLPVVEVNDVTPTQLFVTTPPSGESDLEGY